MTKNCDIILAFDTAMGACSATLYKLSTQEILAKKQELMNRGQAERLVPMIDEIITESGIAYNDIDLIACTHGPGAFTGLRLSLATAKVLSLSLKTPAIGVSTLKALYQSSSDAKSSNVMVCMETKRKDYYCQVFDVDGNELTEPKSSKLEDVISYIEEFSPYIIGDANERLKIELQNQSIEYSAMSDLLHPDCIEIAKIASKDYNPEAMRLQNIEPLYLREADVSFPATKK